MLLNLTSVDIFRPIICLLVCGLLITVMLLNVTSVDICRPTIYLPLYGLLITIMLLNLGDNNETENNFLSRFMFLLMREISRNYIQQRHSYSEYIFKNNNNPRDIETFFSTNKSFHSPLVYKLFTFKKALFILLTQF